MSKRLSWFIISLLLLIIGILIFRSFGSDSEEKEIHNQVAEESKARSKSIHTYIARDTIILIDKFFNVKVESPKSIKLTFDVDGILEKGDVNWKVGKNFSFNDLLVKINIKESYVVLNQLKLELKDKLKSAIENFETDLPEKKDKWKAFNESVTMSGLLPIFPKSDSKAETVILLNSGAVKTYMNAYDQEKKIEKYFYLAPFDGTISRINKRLGQSIGRYETVAEIEPNEGQVLTVLLKNEKVKIPDFVSLFEGDKYLGNAKLVRLKSNQNQNEVSFLVKPEKKLKNHPKNLMVNISSEMKAVRIPENALVGNSVWIKQKDIEISRIVEIVKSENKYSYVIGVNDGEKVILQY